LCRNPAIPARIWPCRRVSLGYRWRAGNSGQTRMNTASRYHSDFFCVASSRTAGRIRNDEVVGSIPTSSTNSPKFPRSGVWLMRCSLAVSALAATALSVACLVPSWLWAQNALDSSNEQESSSTITARQFPSSVNPTRTEVIRKESGNRTVETKVVETLGSNGNYQPYLEIEKETVKVDSATIRTVESSYGWDLNGHKQLVQVKEEETRTLAGGEVQTVRTISYPGSNNGVQVAQKEIEDTKAAGAHVRETKTSVLIPDVNGGLRESVRIERRETQSGEDTVQFQQSTLVRGDASGPWQAREVREGVVTRNDTNQINEEKVSQLGPDHQMIVIERTVRKESLLPNGDSHESVETESVDVPGTPRDGSLHLVQRVTSTHHVGEAGTASTETQIEEPNPGSPASGMRVTSRTLDVVRPGPAGTSQQTTTVQSLDGGGSLREAWVYVTDSTSSSYGWVNLASPAQAAPVASPH